MASKTKTTTKTIKKKGYTKKGEKVTNLSVAMQSGSDRGMFAQWKHRNSAHASGYRIDWEYATGLRNPQTAAQKKKGQAGSLKWFPGNVSTIDKDEAKVADKWFRFLFTAPADAIIVKLRVIPVSETRSVTVSVTQTLVNGKVTKSTQNKESKPYFTANWSGYVQHDFRSDKIPAPTVSAEMGENGTSVTVTVESGDADAKFCTVEACVREGKDAGGNWKHVAKQTKSNQAFSGEKTLTFTGLAQGTTYYFRAMVKPKQESSKADSSWSAWATGATKPAKPGKPTVATTSATSAKVTWLAVAGAAEYSVEYVIGDSRYFSTDPTRVTKVDNLVSTAFEPSGLTAGERYWFRVRGSNDTGDGPWSDAASCVMAVRPSAPTLLDTRPAYVNTEGAELRWVHNTEDMSAQSAYELVAEVYLPDGQTGARSVVENITCNRDTGAFPVPADFAAFAPNDPSDYPPAARPLWALESVVITAWMGHSSPVASRTNYDMAVYKYNEGEITVENGIATPGWKPYAETLGWTAISVEVPRLRYYTNHTSQRLSGTGEQSVILDLSQYNDGAEVIWKVRTKGAHDQWSPWSSPSRFIVYEQPQLSASCEQTVEGFPVHVSLDAAGGGGEVVGYHVAITCAEDVAYVDSSGFDRWMGVGEVAWEADILTDEDPHAFEIGAGDILLVDGASYSLNASVTLASGLSTDADPWPFEVAFGIDMPEPSAEVMFIPDVLCAEIVPECWDVDGEGEPTGELRAGTELAVYRISSDGVLTLLKSGMPNDGTYTVMDPHAPFGECWYHIVARDIETGVSSFADFFDESAHGMCVIQWGERWQEAGADTDAETDWAFDGEMIDGLWNLDFDESGSVEAEDVAYIGRDDPVSYYGTQTGYSATYRAVFPRTDTETLRKLRELMRLRDDFYIREPSGTGFWAHASGVSISRPNGEGTISASINAVRVDRDDSALEETDA